MESSCLYKGKIQHARRVPKEHIFSYNIYYFYINLDELISTKDDSFLCKYIHKRFKRPMRYGEGDLKSAIVNLVRHRLDLEINGPIFLLTQIQNMSFVFNPISVYFCYDKEFQLKSIVSEVNNTPWNEQHCYCVPVGENETVMDFNLQKDFHVSPFMSMDFDYQWLISHPGDSLSIIMHNLKEKEIYFSATLKLKRLKLTLWNLMYCKFRIPLVNFKVVFGIYWQALRLWLKGVAFVSHPKKQG